jgi:hypothetical protein
MSAQLLMCRLLMVGGTDKRRTVASKAGPLSVAHKNIATLLFMNEYPVSAVSILGCVLYIVLRRPALAREVCDR